MNDWCSIPGRVRRGFFLFATMSRPALGLSQPPTQWVPGDVAPGVEYWNMKLTACLRLMLRLRMHGAVPPLLHTSSWCGAYLSIRFIFIA